MTVLPHELLSAEVRQGDVAPSAGDLLPRIGPEGPLVRIRADRSTALVTVQGVGRYLVEDGARVTIEAAADAGTDAVRTWLHGTVTALLAGQQGRFALHASVVEIDGRRVAVAGDTGAGKSTTVVAASRAGGRVISDDVALLEPTDDGVESIPYGRSIHLPADAAERLAVAVDRDALVAPGGDKIIVGAPDAPRGPIHLAVALRVDDGPAPQSRRVDALDAVRVVRRYTFRPRLVTALYPDEVFRWQATVARRLPVHRLRRPRAWSADAVVEEVRRLAGEPGT